MEPIAIAEHRTLTHKPYLNGKQAIVDCGNGLGLSVVWVRGNYTDSNLRLESGLYCDNETYEVALIELPDVSEPFKFSLLPEQTDVYGWVTIEDINALTEMIAEHGILGYMCFRD